jgi:hypothetical protein
MGTRFCGECGVPIANGALPTASSRDPRAYTPKHLVDKILASKSAAEEAIALCRRALLRREGAAARDAVEAALESAAELIERTGAKTLAPAPDRAARGPAS